MSNLGHWANGVKEDNLTRLSLLTKDGFTRQDNQTGNNYRYKVNGMNANGWREIKNPSTHSKEGNWVIINKEQWSILH